MRNKTCAFSPIETSNNSGAMIPAKPEFQTKPPTLLTAWAIMTMSLWGLMLMGPVIVSILIVSVLGLGVLTFLIPLATIAVATFFLPFGFGNCYVARLVRPLRPLKAPPEAVFLVQLTCHPRNRSGFLALLEDADDFGFLSLTDSDLIFDGDSMRLKVPYHQIKELELQNSGWRALFAYGPRTAFSVSGLADAGKFTFAERSSWHLPGSRRNARQLYQKLEQRVQGVITSSAA